MTIDNSINDQLKAFRAKNIPVTMEFDGPVVGHLENVRSVDGKVVGDVVFNEPLPPEWQMLPKVIKLRD